MSQSTEEFDRGHHFRFSFPQQVEKAVMTLKGILQGVEIDGVVKASELPLVSAWCDHYRNCANSHPFSELIPLIDEALSDGVLEPEEIQDILWFCNQFEGENPFFNHTTRRMQQLHGILLGIAADGIVEELELRGLQSWLEENKDLQGTWPFDEVVSVVTKILSENKISDSQQEFLLEFFSDFSKKTPDVLVENDDLTQLMTHGICVSCPEIGITESVFSFTGKSEKASRTELASIVEKHGGTFSKSVTKKVDYLIIGGEGNPTWTFSCYGRKVEQAMNLRKSGSKIQIIHEFDFWDAVSDLD